LNELVERARRDRPAPGVLSSVARSLGVPFLVAPVAALIAPSTAAAALTKVGLGRGAWLAWGAGGTAAVVGVSAALLLSPVAQAPTALPQRPAPAMSVVTALPAAPEMPAAKDETPAVPERRAANQSPPVWDEPRLIEQARRALASEPRRALALSREHQRRFPTGALALEREVIVIEALARTGSSAEARRRALAFEARYPQSIHTPRIRALRERLAP
jgi:hypothetical protein